MQLSDSSGVQCMVHRRTSVSFDAANAPGTKGAAVVVIPPVCTVWSGRPGDRGPPPGTNGLASATARPKPLLAGRNGCAFSLRVPVEPSLMSSIIFC